MTLPATPWLILILVVFAVAVSFSVGIRRAKKARLKGGFIMAFHYVPWSFVAMIIALASTLFGLHMLGAI